MEPQVIEFDWHTAYLDHDVGCGLLVCPDPDNDIHPPDDYRGVKTWLAASRQYGWVPGLSLHEADWNEAVRRLDAIGYEIHEDEDGLPMLEGHTADGRPVYCLYGRESIITEPSLLEIDAALKELDRIVGVVPDSYSKT